MKQLKLAIIFVFIGLGVFVLNQHFSVSNAQTVEYKWDLPKGFPVPNVPSENPMTEAKVELGRHLFYDKRLSINEKTSCATCHLQEKAFTEDKKTSVGTTGEIHPRNSMTLANVAYNPSFNWANSAVNSLERHHLLPMFGTNPIIEMGMEGKEALMLERVKAEPVYEKLFAAAYPNDKEKITLNHITLAIASFVRSMVSGNSPYDKYRYQKQPDAISESAKRGEKLFFSERMECFDCHAGFNLSGTTNFVGKSNESAQFENNGLYNIDGKGAYPAENVGLFEITNNKEDMGKFKVPTLRNIELTAPYMHDGSIDSLEDVIEHYKAGGRTIAEGKYAGKGSENPYKSSFVNGFRLSAEEKQDLIEFLKSLTDKDFITNPKFSDPWAKNEREFSRTSLKNRSLEVLRNKQRK
ncbi:MAG TPA: di-heme enzyme [Pyrinomonadaceae bacterium]|nr:di-heme enzyme [Pyrinomonadaceae bacterium]